MANVGRGRDKSFSGKKERKEKLSNDSNKKMIGVLIDNIFAILSSRSVFQQTIGITMGTNCAPLLTDLVWSRFQNKKNRS